MVIATSITKAYLERSKPFFESVVKYWPGKRVCFTIGFTAIIEGWDCIETPLPECKWQPVNRVDYASLQHGEWVKCYKPDDPNEMIMFVDSDMILQREWDLTFPPVNGVWVTQCSYPQLTLMKVVGNLKPKRRADKIFAKYRISLQREFCACLILAKYSTWQRIYHHCYYLYPLLEDFVHHAAWQLLINAAISNNMKAVLLPPFVCNAEWYEGSTMIDGKVDGEIVYFNHTKFN